MQENRQLLFTGTTCIDTVIAHQNRLIEILNEPHPFELHLQVLFRNKRLPKRD